MNDDDDDGRRGIRARAGLGPGAGRRGRARSLFAAGGDVVGELGSAGCRWTASSPPAAAGAAYPRRVLE
ncbi:MAG: hypothetical protein ACK559_23875, partial [bacterium]